MIPDAVARRLFFYNISTPARPTDAEQSQQDGKLKSIGLTVSETSTLRQELARLRKDFDAEVAQYNKFVELSGGRAPYSITKRLDQVVSEFRKRLPDSVLTPLERRMQSEKSRMNVQSGPGMPMATSEEPSGATPDSTPVTMTPHYSSYSGGIAGVSTLGTIGAGLSVTLEGDTTCVNVSGQAANCPSCTHDGISSITFNGGNTWSPNYPSLGDGTSISSISSGTDGALVALNNLGRPYIFVGQSWTPISAPGTITNLSVYSATSAAAVVYSGSTYKAYQWNPTAGTWTLNSPPVAASANVVKVQMSNGGITFTVLDSTNTAWFYYTPVGGGKMLWAQVSGIVYDIGAMTLSVLRPVLGTSTSLRRPATRPLAYLSTRVDRHSTP
jgi:hypothetical protein